MCAIFLSKLTLCGADRSCVVANLPHVHVQQEGTTCRLQSTSLITTAGAFASFSMLASKLLDLPAHLYMYVYNVHVVVHDCTVIIIHVHVHVSGPVV